MKKITYKFITYFERLIENHIIPNRNIVLFRRCAYLLLLLKMILIWPELSMFYKHVVSIGRGSLKPYELMFLPFFYNYYNFYWLFLSTIVAFGIFKKRSRWLSIAVFIISINYLFLTFKAINFGDMLLNFLIFMLIFIREDTFKYSINGMINNASILIIQVHFCLLYFYNAFGKVMQPFWRDGSFFKNIWRLSYYANSNFIPNWFLNPTSNLLIAWAVILFEFIFPILIWFKLYKKPLIFIGLFFHLGISLFLSLPDFGLAMAIVYILFFNLKQDTSSNINRSGLKLIK